MIFFGFLSGIADWAKNSNFFTLHTGSWHQSLSPSFIIYLGLYLCLQKKNTIKDLKIHEYRQFLGRVDSHNIKVQIFWEGHKNLAHLSLSFDILPKYILASNYKWKMGQIFAAFSEFLNVESRKKRWQKEVTRITKLGRNPWSDRDLWKKGNKSPKKK